MSKFIKLSCSVFLFILFIGNINAHNKNIFSVSQAAESNPPESFNVSQKNAFKSAEEYLNTSSFSRKGLINQLSSTEGFPQEDATVAVDALNVDWREQAVKTASSYLEQQGFSYRGLVNQLSSTEGFSKEDATAAVDSLNVDWKEQAVKTANSYLEQQGFSCKGLIDQLSSSASDNYTIDEASYAAKKVGLCSSTR